MKQRASPAFHLYLYMYATFFYLYSYYIILCKIFVLTYLKMA